MARRSIKIPPKDTVAETSSNTETYNDVLNSLDSIQTKRKESASSYGASEPTVNRRTLIMATGIIGIAAILLLTFGSPLVPESDEGMTLGSMDFEIELLNSSKVLLSDYEGKPILLDFFATWCGPCKTQITELQKIQAKFPNVHILSVSIEPDDTIGLLETYSSDNDMDWFVGRDHTRRGKAKFYVSNIPTMAFFNSQGIRKYANHPPGVTSEATMSNWIIAD